MKTLYFQQITDGRFDKGDLLLLLKIRIELLVKALLSVNVTVTVSEPYCVNWTDHLQYRVNFWVKKGKGVTWNNVYKIVNDIKPVPYKFI